MRFQGTETYVATDDLKLAVNAAIALERPLLVKGEPGTGKTVLAEEIAAARSARRSSTWHIKSTTKAQQGLYEYDAVSRLRDCQLGDERVSRHPQLHPQGQALGGLRQPTSAPVLLIDEIDKADIEFPNDLLRELDRMEFYVYETGETVARGTAPDRRHHLEQREGAARRLPAPLLLPLHPLPRRRDDEPHRRRALTPASRRGSSREALRIFFEMREVPGLKKKPSTSELLDWLKLLLAEDIGPEAPARARSARSSSRRCTARCSRTSRTCTCSSSWRSWRGGRDGELWLTMWLIRPCRSALPAGTRGPH